MSSDPDPDRRRRLQRDALQSSPLFAPPPQPQALEPTSRDRLINSRLSALARRTGRPRMLPSDRYQESQRGWRDNNSTSSVSNFTLGDIGEARMRLEDASNMMEDASSSLRARLEDPLPSLPSSGTEYPDPESRRVKRRKLNTDKKDAGFQGFSYGRYGQVEPGKLKMEIVSCDGGIFEMHRGEPREEYEPENVLLDDTSVYCTKSNRCNLVLRHQGNTTFCLTELIIKAPHKDYTAPIQDGLVFVSMTSDDLLTRTANYQIQYSPPRNRRSALDRSQDELPPIISIRHNVGDGTMSTAQARARRLYDIGLQDEDCDSRTAQIPTDFTSTAPGFSNTTECSDSEDDSNNIGLRPRHRRPAQYTPFDDGDSDWGEDLPRPPETPWHEYYLGASTMARSLRRRETASNITLDGNSEASQATQESVEAEGGELMIPHANFFIESNKSKCTVKFDPPVSGRFILLKMWSPHPSPSENIDIQSIVCKGFAGPRYFPALGLR
ncbi:hypothetical protein HYALB_00003822 [Hymenoscyphus albidus]|uniref:Regulator of chromosome condensation-like protein n=1 Tax=Hymenoscyphus albidus TaxID=595503 RepID=A0A9N9QAM3_9HELO|nr:hypothetical protein HYALB_00003822 [Hymenoscyphus albidus]